MHVLVIGAGIGGLTTALSLHAAGIGCTIAESATRLKPLGVGINLQPHAVRELTELGLGDALAATGIETSGLAYANRHGDVITTLPRGRNAGYRWPQYSIHRGRLQMILAEAVRDRLGPHALRLGLAFDDFQDDPQHGGAGQVAVRLRDRRTGQEVLERADALVGADGVHSAVRARLYPHGDPLRWSGITMWRGITETDPYLDGASMVVAGADDGAKIVAYPICPKTRARGRASVNWVAEVRLAGPGPAAGEADWRRQGGLEDVLPHFAGWRLPFMDVPAMLAGAGRILQYPMVDRDPLPAWGAGRVSLLGDAAHPMYPVGSNGGSQAILDARYLALALAGAGDAIDGLAAYEDVRRPETSDLVLASRRFPVDETVKLVEQRAPGGFADIHQVLTPQELAAMAEAQRAIADMDVEALNERPSWSVPTPR
ncbi:2-polyprenyl-6-methoxyphenol hydroxylase-like FAD-dependent oxidoreductase [Thermocatellispora tengchongensis]|uniref:2-polyprenyl-6-methoxyphenol hydroxylase-like FAD-dependent oxidoreductase n=1 Tax=Thermocatellispora tengchongensis TaxID=1073253 RepID=A0A840PN22_9ACTN|nr:flavin-dependent oxidoreductase [Thermocatellispora tengchongensis]MBB5137435.1 2-polyprenyl-6-methoxyphenol hydroxylase-like FAD-dependent oxidoreductase [Thermocatellispora tengchongensis]